MARRMIEEEDVNVLILTDRGVNREFARGAGAAGGGGPASLSDSRRQLRTRVSLVLETGEAREVHHFALLIGYGCSAINPYLAFETIDDMISDGLLTTVDHKLACKNFVKAATKGVIKVAVEDGHLRDPELSRRAGVRSRRPAPGRHRRLLHRDRFARRRHRRRRDREGSADAPSRGVPRPRPMASAPLDTGGQYQWRADGEYHLFNPESIHRLQKSVRTGSYATYKSYAELINDQSKQSVHAARPARFQAGRCGTARGSRVRREHRASASRPARCPTARSARKRTRRSRSR